ncbi:sulfotransferase family protein [Baaleninema simplex]|uniref:sulfotransferase family protein n=1 Tax=Baaleninema simplex TaxID=2862350 RepID=UPI00037E9D11|nr:sulfotransferase [Baaleninema simplex]
MSNPRPNLFIIGAMKAGTTSLHHYINTHPEAFMCEPKEPCYFVAPDQLHWENIKKLELWKDENRYLDLFREAGEAKIIGESSTLYAKAPHITGIPERIVKFNPDARFIYVLRDPIPRTISHYWHEIRQGSEFRDILSAIKENPLYRNVSHYSEQLKRYYEYFDRDRLLVLSFEEMTQTPTTVIRQVFEWLGINADFVPPNIDRKIHVTPQKFPRKDTLFRLRYRWPFRQIADALPKSVRNAGKQVAVKEFSQEIDPDVRQATVNYLRPIQQEQTRELTQLLGREFPEWKQLWGSGDGES